MQSASLAYLYSRFPVVSQTFCDTEMLAMERLGQPLVIGSINPPPSSFRHPHLALLQAEVIYPAPPAILKLWEEHIKELGLWPKELIARQEAYQGKEAKPAQRARNAIFFAREFLRRGVRHVHVHFTNRAAHTALFIKHLAGIPYSVTAHAQDFMVDLGNDELLREILNEAEFVIAVSDFSRDLLAKIAPEARIHRVYNGQDLAAWPVPPIPNPQETAPPLILSVGRLIEFKGFHKLVEACGLLRARGLDFRCEIAGEGPWRPQLEAQITSAGLGETVKLLGVVNGEQVRARLAESAVFALGSLVDEKGAMDILPTVILEAMAAGKPVVSTQLAGIPEMVAEGRSGLLVPPGEAVPLAEALEKVLGNAALRAEFGRAGRELLETVFSAEQTAPGLLARFQDSTTREPVSTDFREKLGAPAGKREAGQRVVYWIPSPPGDPRDLVTLLRELAWVRKACADAQPQLGFAVLWGQFPSNLPDLPPEYGEALRSILRQSRFAPDGLVLEAAWQADRQGALGLEGFRQGLPPGLPTLAYLEQARFILSWLREQMRELPGHWHSLGEAGLLSAWLLEECGLARETGSTLSCLLPEPSPTWPKALIKSLCGNLEGGRVPTEAMVFEMEALSDTWIRDTLGNKLSGGMGRKKGLDGVWQALGIGARAGLAAEQWTDLLRKWAVEGRSRK